MTKHFLYNQNGEVKAFSDDVISFDETKNSIILLEVKKSDIPKLKNGAFKKFIIDGKLVCKERTQRTTIKELEKKIEVLETIINNMKK